MNDGLYSFGAFVLDARLRLLTKNGAPIAVGHRGLALLQALLAAGGRVVGKSELLEIAWPAQVVEESNLTVQMAALRKIIGTQPDGQEWISTVPRVGYRFLQIASEPVTDNSANGTTVGTLANSRTSIAVLPFVNLSSSREQDFLADGMTDDIIAALSRIGALFVVARSSSFTFKGRTVPAKEAARELDVRYILDGSIRVAGNRVRVNAQLIDGLSGDHVWVDHYEGDINECFAVQDEITRNIALALQVKLNQGESAWLWEGQTQNLRAWEKFIQAREAYYRFTTIDNGIARKLLEEALLIDPDYTGAMGLLGLTYYWDARYGVSTDKALSLNLAERQAERILQLNPEMGAAYILKGLIAFTRDEHDEAIRICGRAIDLAPTDYKPLGFLGQFYQYAGEAEKAVVTIKSAMRLNPHRESWLTYYLTLAHLWAGNLAAALESAESYVQQQPEEPYGLVYLAVVHGLQNEDIRAAAVVTQLKEKFPAFGIKNVILSERYKEQEKLDRIVNLLRAAGMPE